MGRRLTGGERGGGAVLGAVPGEYYIVEHDQPTDYGTIADSLEFLSSTLPGVLGQ